MIIFNFLKTFVSEVVSWVKANSVSTACLIGLPVVTINMLNNVDKKSTRLKSIDDKYRSKRYPAFAEKPAEKLTYERIYHKGMNVVAFAYDKNTGTIKERLNTTKSIKEMAKLYLIHPTIVSNCAVYNSLGSEKIIFPKKKVVYTYMLPVNMAKDFKIGDILKVKEKKQ